jgi:hypothetical protein
VLAAFTAANILPIILTPSTVQSVYTSLISSLGFGMTTGISADYSNVYSVAVTQLQAMFKYLWTSVQQDTYGFVQSVSAAQSLSPPSNVTSLVNMQFPTAYLNQFTSFPTIIIDTMGWGSTSIIAEGIFYNYFFE